MDDGGKATFIHPPHPDLAASASLRPPVLSLMKRLLPLLLPLALAAEEPAAWPELDARSRPWLRWHWPADAETEAATEAELKAIAKAGFSGVEMVTDGRASGWPGPGWVEHAKALAHACEELGLGFDLATQVGDAPTAPADLPDDGERGFAPFVTRVAGGPVDLEIPEGAIDCLGAWPPQGGPIDLIEFVDPETRRLRWDAPAGTWTIYGAIHLPEGPALDPFSPAAMLERLDRFEDAFITYDAPFPRARVLEQRHGSRADWSFELIPAFQRLRGYNLREKIPTLLGDATPGATERALSDYEETLDDLRYETLLAWHQHANAQGSLSRTLLAADPGHPLDVHSVADIPGTLVEATDQAAPLITTRFAASAAHLTFKPLVQGSFRSDSLLTPARLKTSADMLWLAGVNQLVLDGRSATRDRTALDPGGGLWRHLDAFTAYADRCQSVLQTGAPDPDLLLYFPAHDFHIERDGLPDEPAARERWLEPTGFHRTARAFDEGGVSYEIISDRLLRQAVATEGRIILGGLSFAGIVLPEVRRLPETTATRLLDLARAGARIGILGEWPRDVPGLPSPDIRRGTLIRALEQIPDGSLRESIDPLELATMLGIAPEPMAGHGLRFIRRHHADGRHYFVVNPTDQAIDARIALATPATAVRLLDPRFPERSGFTPVEQTDEGPTLRLALEPGESRILRSYYEDPPAGPAWKDHRPDRRPLPIAGTWNVEFLEGGPTLPEPFATPLLGSWKSLADPAVREFTGIGRYTIEFELSDPGDAHWQLDLGGVAHSAEIHLNGLPAGTAFAPPHRFDVTPLLQPGLNTLSIRVSNLRAPDRPDLPAGLLGPVRLLPLVEDDGVAP